MKLSGKAFGIFVIVLNILAALMVPLDFFIVNVPAWLCVIFAALAVTADFFYCLRASRLGKKIALSVFTAFFQIIILFFALLWPYWNSRVFKRGGRPDSPAYDSYLSQKQALEDIDYVWHYLNKLHPAMLNKKGDEYKTAKEAYENQRAKIASSEKITMNEMARAVERTLSVLRDAHTAAYPRYTDSLYYKEVQHINDSGFGFHGINGLSYQELLTQKSDLFSYEKEAWALIDVANYSIRTDMLDYMEIDISDGITYILKADDGTIKEQKAYADEFVTIEEYKKYNEGAASSEEKPFVFYTIDDEHSLAILTLKSCKNNNEYKDCLQKMFEEVKAKEIRNLAVDLRKNGGGSSLVINNFFKYLNIDEYWETSYASRFGPFIIRHKIPVTKNSRVAEDLIFHGKVFVLTSESSFSSAMMFPQYVKDNGIGKIIGETPANDPNGYGDVVNFSLPNSKIFMQISFKKFLRINQNTTEKYVEPDYPCKAEDVFEELYRHCM